MAVTKILNIGDCGTGYHGKHLKAAIDYIKASEKTDGGRLVGGINCQPDFAYDRMKSTKVKFGKQIKDRHIISLYLLRKEKWMMILPLK